VAHGLAAQASIRRPHDGLAGIVRDHAGRDLGDVPTRAAPGRRSDRHLGVFGPGPVQAPPGSRDTLPLASSSAGQAVPILAAFPQVIACRATSAQVPMFHRRSDGSAAAA